MKNTIIIAPHADDEIIGCYDILIKNNTAMVLYGSEKAKEEGVNTSSFFSFERGVIMDIDKFIGKGYEFHFPDPYFETHPLHKELAYIGEKLLRKGENVHFYSVNMQAPYIYEVHNAEEKKKALNTLYQSKMSLWQYDYKYYLFEGHVQWEIKVD